MNTSCPYRHVSYSTLRLQVLRQLWADTTVLPDSRLPFLYPRLDYTARNPRHEFHTSRARPRNNVKDVRRSAKFKAVQLKLGKHVKNGTQDTANSTSPVSSSKFSVNENGWNPHREDGIQELQNLVSDLRIMVKGARAGRGAVEETVPFESSITLSRSKSSLPESPLERRMPWDRAKKLQVHQVDRDKRLLSNIWAQILASPVRMDRGTKARIPRDLTASWGIMQNPKDSKQYLLPIELSDMEALRQEIQPVRDSPQLQDDFDQPDQSVNPNQAGFRPRPGTRVQITANRLLLQAMTDDLTAEKYNNKTKSYTTITLSPRLAINIIPQRWKHKHEEMKAFHQTRERFNKVLDRQPDDDELNMGEVAQLRELQWQPNVAQRMEKMMSERILIVLEKVGKDNGSNRAIHHRNVMASAIPPAGQLWVDATGRASTNQPSIEKSNNVQAQEITAATMPDWVHGAFILHIGSPEAFHSMIKQWQQASQVNSSIAQTLHTNKLIPPTIHINQQYSLPVFNLEALLSPEHSPQLKSLISSTKIFDLKFWQGDDQSRKSSPPPSSSTDFDSDIKSTVSTDESTLPRSPLDAGEQVFSSIVTPGLGAGRLPRAEAPRSSPPTKSSNQTGDSSEKGNTDKGYLLIVKPRARHAMVLIREIWQFWRFIGGWKGLDARIHDERGSGS